MADKKNPQHRPHKYPGAGPLEYVRVGFTRAQLEKLDRRKASKEKREGRRFSYGDILRPLVDKLR